MTWRCYPDVSSGSFAQKHRNRAASSSYLRIEVAKPSVGPLSIGNANAGPNGAITGHTPTTQQRIIPHHSQATPRDIAASHNSTAERTGNLHTKCRNALVPRHAQCASKTTHVYMPAHRTADPAPSTTATMPSKSPLEVDTAPKSTSASSRSTSPRAPTGPWPWEKPGPIGALRRAHRALQRYAWDDPDKPREEKWFLFKLDCFLLTSACLGYFSKNLDHSNIGNAYVSGMKEALRMEGITGRYAGDEDTAIDFDSDAGGCVVGIDVLHGVGDECVAAYLVSSWYTKGERGKRVALFYSAAALAGMFSGYLQAGAYSGLNGRHGLEGWQWLFIVCGVISLPIAFLGYFFIPDFPETTRAFYITPAEAEKQRQRLIEEGQKPLGHNPWNRTKILHIAKQWQFWVLPLGYFLVQASFPIHQPAYALWLKSTGHSVYQRNVWPTGQVALGVVVQVIGGMLSDSPLLKGRRWPLIIVMQVGTLIGASILAAWDVSDSVKIFAFYISFFSAGAPGPYFAWYSDLIPHDHEMRGFVIASSNIFSHTNSIWYTIAAWRTVNAPRFHTGFTAASVLGGGNDIVDGRAPLSAEEG
ncbi:hypothetical protein OPT61_g9577 [Boeremia exigua]|uniref:Uncharacterized protein n=1 Tax=Boeremia exigua TaxID=749465 RepID=A0ACC2HUB2_9PLEO|nr:hypothetical protein OPT61_g9577 [Boeremia exigua]